MPLNETTELVRAFDWHAPSWDLFIFLFWLVASVFYTFASGRGRIINILFSVYIAKLLTLEAPFLTEAISSRLPENILAVQQLVVFVILFLLIFIFIAKYAFQTSADHRKIRSLFFGLLFSLLQIGLLINTVLTLLPLTVQSSFSPLIQTLFILDPASFIWLVAPLGFLVALGRYISHHNEL